MITEQRVRTPDGTSLNVTKLAGDGNPVVFLHGFTGDGSTIQHLAELSRGPRPALLIDVVGHGQSDSPADDEPYRMASVVDQVLSLIGQHEAGRVHLVGYSMGGRIALSIAARAPWHFGSITSISATAGISDPSDRLARQLADDALAGRLEQIGLETFVDEWLLLEIFEPLISRLSPDELAATRRQRLGNNVVGLAGSLRGTGTGSMPPVWETLGSVRSPLLAIAGEFDIAYVETARRLAEHAFDGRAAIIGGCGHAVHLENPEAVATPLAQFLEGCETSQSI